MRLTALIPVLVSAAALVLSFLALFAGNKPSFMQDYHMLTLNVSQIGNGLVNSTLSSSSTPLSSLWNKLPSSLQSEVGAIAGEVADAITAELGISEFYAVHLLDYCEGSYTPTSLPNGTIPLSAIHKNTTACSPPKAMFWFDPTTILSAALAKSGLGITLADLNWPADIDKALTALRIASQAAFVLFCIATALIACVLLASLVALFTSGRLSACLNVMLALLAFLAIALASALTTAVIVKGSAEINKYGALVNVRADRGGKFMAISWAATAAMLVALVWWLGETCIGHRRHSRKSAAYANGKHG